MIKINRHGSTKWQGGIKDGKGSVSTESGALKAYPYGFASRFEGMPGTNPEELIAAAHAGCFTMALPLILGKAKLTAEQMETSAQVMLEQVEDSCAITAVHLTLKARIPGADQATFEKLAGLAKAGCPLGEEVRRPVRHLFLFIGADPNTDWLAGSGVALDPKGFVLTGAKASANRHLLETTCPGVFAIGDVRSGSVKRVAASVGDGAQVVAALHGYLAASS